MKPTPHREQSGSNGMAPAGVLEKPRSPAELELLNYLHSLCQQREAAAAHPFIEHDPAAQQRATRH